MAKSPTSTTVGLAGYLVASHIAVGSKEVTRMGPKDCIIVYVDTATGAEVGNLVIEKGEGKQEGVHGSRQFHLMH